jgi:hypothetical protein
VRGINRTQGDYEHEFFGLASKSRSTVSPGLASKPVATVLVVWPQNHSLGFFLFVPQNRQMRFGDLGHKITATFFWFEHQNQVDYDLSVAPQNRQDDEDGVEYASRSSGLLHL